MELSIRLISLFPISRLGRKQFRSDQSPLEANLKGERGEAVLNLILLLTSASLLYGALFWLNKTYETKTKEHLYDFETRWNHLGKKYQD